MSNLLPILAVALFGCTGIDCTKTHLVSITNKASGLALTARPYPYGEGQVLIQEPLRAGDPLQCWALQPVGPCVFRIVNPATGLALEVLQGDSRTPVTLYCNRNAPTQNWRVAKFRNSNHFQLTPALHDNRRLDVPKGTELISLIQIYKPNSSDAQLWNLIPAR